MTTDESDYRNFNLTTDLDLEFDHDPTTSSPPDQMTSVDVASILVSLFVFLFIFSGNLMTLLAVYRTPALRVPPHLHIVSLALADLLSGVMLLYQTIKYLPGLTDYFNASKMLCLSRHAVLVTSLVASGSSIVLVAFDRFLYIQRPLHYDRLVTKRRTVWSVVCAWIVSLLTGTVSLYHNNWEQSSECSIFQVFTALHNVYIIGTIYVIYCLVIGACYCSIIVTACRQRQATPFNSNGDVVIIRGRFNQGWPVARMFLLVYATFVLCWTPCMVTMMLGYTVGVDVKVMNFLIPLGVVNCGLNFIIYAVMNSDFRAAFRKMLS